MEFPPELSRALEDEAAHIPPQELAAAARALSQRYRDKEAQTKRLRGKTEAAAYALSRMPATFGAVSAVLEWIQEMGNFSPVTLLDVGAGTGAASWAAEAVFPLERIVCLEQEESMRQMGRRLMQGSASVLRGAEWMAGDLLSFPLPKSQLVISSYVLNELPEGQRLKAAERLWEAAEGLLVIVEPGTPEGSGQLSSIREHLLRQGAGLLAPCPSSGPCPMEKGDWCHFARRVARSRLHRQLKGGEAPFEDEKFCYLAFSRGKGMPAKARVLRHPVITTGKVSLTLCTGDAVRQRELRKRDGEAYKAARKLRSGDPFDCSEGIER